MEVYRCEWSNKGCLLDLLRIAPCPLQGFSHDEFYAHAKTMDITDEDFKVISQKCFPTSSSDTTELNSVAIVIGVLVALAVAGVLLFMYFFKKGKINACKRNSKVSAANYNDVDDRCFHKTHHFICEIREKTD